jgi:succinoglycan biosynthesis protein ExoM
MNNIILCICTYNRNKKLINCLKSIEKLKLSKKFRLEILVLDNSINFLSKNIVENYKKKIDIKIFIKNEKKRGVVFARNACLDFVRKKKPKYVGFVDDDCVLDQYWLINTLKTIKEFNADIVTGPQHYNKINQNNNKLNFTKFFEKKYKKNILKVKWAATNNVFFNFNILKTNNIKFDKNLNKFGMGEDQLFFIQMTKLGKIIYWSNEIKVTEVIHNHRLNLKWLIIRSFRLGILGNYIDRKVYGNLLGLIITYSKSIYFFFKFILHLLLPLKKDYIIILNIYFFKASGKFLGPFIFKKIKFLN